MLVYLGIILIAVLVYFLWFHYDLMHAVYLSLKIDGPTPLPIIGSGLMFINKTLAENSQLVMDLVRQYGVFFKVWLGTELDIIISDPKDVEIILTSPRYIDKSTVYKFLNEWLNDGLLLSTGKKWHDRRKAITPAFHFNILEKFVEVFDRLGNTVVEKLSAVGANEAIEFYPIASLYTLDVMCETAMGVSIDALSKPNSEYVLAVKKTAHVALTRMFDFLLRYSVFYKFSSLAKQQKDALHILHSFTDDVIRKRRLELLTSKINNSNNDQENEEDKEIGIRQKRPFLDSLLHVIIDGKPLTDLEIREEVDTFMFEGHDTTTSGMSFCLFNIARYPDVQRKCYAEIVEVFGSNLEKPTTLSQLNQLSYLELTLRESLRLYPPVPFIGRVAMNDIELTNNRVIPKGANVAMPIISMGRNEKFFEDPEEFRPERFLKERSIENSFMYIPFSAGPRNCIGQKFAVYEIKSILSKILLNFEISLTKDSEADPILYGELILRSENQIKFYFKRRV